MELIRVNDGERLDQARELMREHAAGLGDDLWCQDFEHELSMLPGEYGPPGGCLLLAVWEGQAAGCVALRELGKGFCEMKRLYVRTEFRGHGIGRRLAGAIIDAARAIGYGQMRLDTLSSLEAAISLYETLGFKRTEPYRYNPPAGVVFMELRLA